MNRSTDKLIAAVMGVAAREFGEVIRTFKASLPRHLRDVGALPELKNPLDIPRAAELSGMSIRSVKRYWNSDIHGDFSDAPRSGRKRMLSDDVEKLVMVETHKRLRGTRTVSKMMRAGGTPVSHMTIWRLWRSRGLRPWKRRREPYSSAEVELARVAFLEYNWQWALRNWRMLVPSDEFYLHAVRRPNGQNDIVWSRTREEVEEMLRAPQIAYHAVVGVFLCFTSKRMAWHIKDDGESWSGDTFREIIIPKVVRPLLEQKADIEGHVTSSCLLHDNAPGWRANATQAMLRDERFDSFPSSGEGRYPPYSPFFNPCEMLGAYIQNQVEARLMAGPAEAKLKTPAVRAALLFVLRANEYNSDMFVRLLRTFPHSLRLAKASDGKPIRYSG